MRLYDISREVFSSPVYPGDPAPVCREEKRISRGDLYNLTAFSMCAHNGTHTDAPFHFLENGKTIDEIPLERTVGRCYVAAYNGALTRDKAAALLSRAAEAGEDAAKRILLKGTAIVTEEAAEVFAAAGVCLVGVESQSVGDADAPMAVHLLLLKREVVLLEGIVLDEVEEGSYFLFAAPLKLGGADGAPCRAVLMK